MQIFPHFFFLKNVKPQHFLTFLLGMCWRIYFKVSPLPLSLIDDAKVQKKVETTKCFPNFFLCVNLI